MTALQSLIGQTLGQYQIIEQIGEGGMATVFKAYQPGLNRHVALKVLPPYIAKKEGFTERFSREAQAIGNLHHPNILPVYDTGQDKGYGYLAMRYIPQARTLSDLMKQPLTHAQIIRLVSQIADALDHAHQAGIVHRDVKPSNILMDGDWVLLSDFGLAKMIEMPSEITGTGVGIGTPAYMSPEQAKGEKVDHRTDLYALGIILFEMLTGQVPHKAETPLATVMKRISEPPPSPCRFNQDISPAVEAMLLKALATDPARRFNSAQEMASVLQGAFADKLAAPPVDVDPQTILSAPQSALPAPAAMPADRPPAQKFGIAVAVSTMILPALFSLCGLGGALMSLNDVLNGQSIAIYGFSGMLLTGLSSLALIGFAYKRQLNWLWSVAGITCWLIGATIFSWGITATLNVGSQSFVENFSIAAVLLFTPGGILSLLGLLFYGYAFRRARKIQGLTKSQAMMSTEQASRHTDTLQRAADYRARIANQLKQAKGSPLVDSLMPIVSKLTEWDDHLRQLVNQLNDFEANSVIQRDLRDVPAAISRYQTQLRAETNPQLRAQIQETLAGYQRQQQQLDALVTVMRRTELEIDETLAEIGAIYSRLQLLDAKGVDSSRAKRLSADIEEQSNRLSDLLKAMDEVYDSSAGLL